MPPCAALVSLLLVPVHRGGCHAHDWRTFGCCVREDFALSDFRRRAEPFWDPWTRSSCQACRL